jgi:hypothetical protein
MMEGKGCIASPVANDVPTIPIVKVSTNAKIFVMRDVVTTYSFLFNLSELAKGWIIEITGLFF